MTTKLLKRIKESLSEIDLKLFWTLVLISILPAIYKTVRIHFIGQLPDDWGFNIASQLAWINVIQEVVHEALILPMFYFIGKSLDSSCARRNKVKTGLILTTSVYGLFAITIAVFIRPMLIFMAQKSILLDASVAYIRLELLSLVLLTSAKFLTLVLISLRKRFYLVLILVVQMILSIILDTVLVSNMTFSAQLGVNGIAITNIGVGTIQLVILSYILFQRGGELSGSWKHLDFDWLKEWLKVGGISGLESFVRNSVFILMILRMVNLIEEQGTFWVTNSFIWGWLLLPIFSLGELIKRDSASESNYNNRILGYFVITGLIVLFWFISIPLWSSFIQNIMGIKNHQAVFNLSLLSIAFYVVFAFNNIIDSIFYGRGRTDLMLYQSLFVNIIFYGIVFAFYYTGNFIPTLRSIVIIFGLGMLVDSLVTFIMYYFFRKKLSLH
ncbi:MAG: multidrug transporter [Candidatus Marinimicrobia bacterium]|jgi:Na+-driven multidrug efflux pump|nr:multidrug transporter [Candidatus Neomarinimicrobiota bacterium]